MLYNTHVFGASVVISFREKADFFLTANLKKITPLVIKMLKLFKDFYNTLHMAVVFTCFDLYSFLAKWH